MARSRSYREVRWPFNGLHVGRSFHGQASDTTVACRNVRNYDPRTGRARGAQRPGVTRLNSGQASGTGNKQIQDIIAVTTVPTSSGVSLTNLAAREAVVYCVCDGTVQTVTSSGFTTVSSGSSALSATAPVIFSAPLFGKLYYADGTNWKYWTGSAMATWTASAGSLPVSGSDKPRLIEQWRTRIVMSGLRGDVHNWFMSACGDPTDFDYGATASPTIAASGNNADAGYVGDIINTMIPYDDDTLLFGCDHSIWQMSGDPAEGGRIDEISDIAGMAFGRPWCKAYDGTIYFMGSRGGIYKMVLGSKPERISADRIEENLNVVDLNQMIVRCIYDDVQQGIYFFITPLNGTSATTHYFYCLRSNAFFADYFKDPLMNPVAICTVDGDTPTDRKVLLGGFDRRVRYVDYDSKSDDTEAIDSYVWMGPLRVEETQKLHLNELIGTLDEDADHAYYEAYGAQGAQSAYERGQMFYSGVWGPGRNWPDCRRASGSAIYLKVGNSELDSTWSYESAYAAITPAGSASSRSAF